MSRLIYLAFSCFLLTSTELVYADYISPEAVQVKTEAYHPEISSFEKGSYYYNISWEGIPVGRAQVDVNDEENYSQPMLRVKASTQTTKFIDFFYRLRHTSESVFHAETFRPHHFYSWQKENSREKSRNIEFSDDGRISTVSTTNGSESDRLEFHSDNFTLDPITAAFEARSLPLAEGKSVNFDVFNGKHRYLITFTVGAKEKLSVGGKSYEAFRVTPTVKKLTDSEGETRLKSATLWISAGPDREVLKLKSDVLVGSVSAELAKYTPKADSPAPDIVRARLSSDPASLKP